MRQLYLLLILFLFAGCTTSSYDTFKSRSTAYDVQNIKVTEGSLQDEQIKTILGTQFPKEHNVSISVFTIPYPGYYGGFDTELREFLVKGISRLPFVERVVPIPSFLVPQTITFDVIQQLGIRSLSEYSLLFFGNVNSSASWTLISSGKYQFNSVIDFLLVDNETTAIIASDKLISKIDVNISLFTDKEITAARTLLFSEQEKILINKMNNLFKKSN